jgi:hypothetical protein
MPPRRSSRIGGRNQSSTSIDQGGPPEPGLGELGEVEANLAGMTDIQEGIGAKTWV